MATSFAKHAALSQSLFLCLILAHLAFTARFFTEYVVPEDLSSACKDALQVNVDCSHAVPALQAGTFYPKAELQQIFTSNCASSLASYHAGIVSACGDNTWVGFQDVEEPVDLISEMIRYHYYFTCIMDGDRFCHNCSSSIFCPSGPRNCRGSGWHARWW